MNEGLPPAFEAAPGSPELVYFMEADGFGIKIGYSNNPQRRLLEIRSHCPFAVKLLFAVVGGVEREQDLHREFRDDKIRGEWFRPSQRLLSRIAAIRAQEVCFNFQACEKERASGPGNPAQRVIVKCGSGDFSRGIDALARWTGKHHSNVYRWATKGIIPTPDQQIVFQQAQREGIALLPEDFFYTKDELAPQMAQAAGR